MEDAQWRSQQYCPPPTNPKFLQEPSVAYRKPSNYKVSVKAVETSESQQNEQPVDAVVNRSDGKIKCWNCNEQGHRYNDCLQLLSVHCFRCKKPEFTSRTCPNCSGNENRRRH